MQIDIRFRNMEHSDSLDTQARQGAEKLATLYDRLIRCEVSIENTHRSHQHGPRFRVRIHLDVPGQDIEVSRDQGDHEDAHVAVSDAFKIAKRQLAEHIRLLRGDTKHATLPDVDPGASDALADDLGDDAPPAAGS